MPELYDACISAFIHKNTCTHASSVHACMYLMEQEATGCSEVCVVVVVGLCGSYTAMRFLSVTYIHA